jgi:hypothetical protein
MKKRMMALLAAAAMCLSLAACTISTPSVVGKIGDVEITSGMYLLCQFQAFTTAQSKASSTQDTTKVKAFLKQKFEAESTASSAASSGAASESAAGSDAEAESSVIGQSVSEYVAAETLRNMQYYAAVKTRFAALGGKLTEQEISEADSLAQNIWDANSNLYAKNGFGLDAIKEYEYTLTMANDLLALVYGPEGEQAVSDADLTDYLENDLVYGYYISVPLYNSSTYAFADADQQQQIKDACQAVVDEYTQLHSAGTPAETVNGAVADSAVSAADSATTSSGAESAADSASDSASSAADSADTSAATQSETYQEFYQAVQDKLPDAYAVLNSDFDASNVSITTNFIDNESMSYYGDDADKIRGCAVGEGVVVALGSYSYEIFVREDPLAVNTLDDVRTTALQDWKGQELQDALYAYGADTLENDLDASAMKQLPAAKIKLASSSNAAA